MDILDSSCSATAKRGALHFEAYATYKMPQSLDRLYVGRRRPLLRVGQKPIIPALVFLLGLCSARELAAIGIRKIIFAENTSTNTFTDGTVTPDCAIGPNCRVMDPDSYFTIPSTACPFSKTTETGFGTTSGTLIITESTANGMYSKTTNVI